MNKIYLIIIFITVVCMAFFAGTITGNYKCQNKIALATLQEQQEFLKEKRIINETVYKTSASDIRSILLSKYTIAE